MLRVTVWNENIHDKEENVKKIYPKGIHGAIADILHSEYISVTVATLDSPNCGLTDEVLNRTDVMIWWGHVAHNAVPDEIAQKVVNRVLAGMGLIVLHSGHYSKPFRLLMGTTCSLRWREPDFERVWCIDPSHPISQGVPAMFELEQEEMYGEAFDIPYPDDVIFGGWFRGGEIFRSVCTFHRGAGKIVYIQFGHETYPVYHNIHVQTILKNAVRWAKPIRFRTTLECFHSDDTPEERFQRGISFEDMQY